MERGFSSIEEMNEIIIERWNKIVKQDDIVYHLGDVFMGTDKEVALKMVQRLNGKICLAYEEGSNVIIETGVELCRNDAYEITY